MGRAAYTPPVLRFSVAIIARDEEEVIVAAVASAAGADEVLVLDSGSSDRTLKLAAAAGARVEQAPWQGYGAQKNLAAGLCRNHWVFSLDADERIGSELAAAIAELPEGPAVSAFRVRRRNRYAGRVIRRWPWSWDMQTRLYDRRRARFVERQVHETLACDGEVLLLRGVLEHHGDRRPEAHARRQLEYARLGAEEALARGRRPRPGDQLLHPAVAFLRLWLGRGYLLNGGLGWHLSRLAAEGTRMKYQRLRELSGRA